ncbi:MAG: tRNA lysidine(34) synthetase, partial [Candidatus Saccharibacteria bacterium]|nr:tRNA lysidine(34) synthetase [Candidatus Saccharibacteria bacterium]
FVRHLAEDIYHLPFYSHKRFLGENTSENLARLSRYDFLKSLAKKHNAIIYTAHHADDLLESIAINLLRGTSYHGLLPFGDSEIKHPFLTPTLLPETSELSHLPIIKKSDLYKYATKNHLTFREDPTNHENKYLRNYLRQKLQFLSSEKKQKLLNLYKNTLLLDKEIHKNLPLAKTFSRDFFREIPEIVALEILRENFKQYNLSLTRPQLKNLLSAIKTYSPEKSFNLPGNRLLKLHKSTFTLDIFQ